MKTEQNRLRTTGFARRVAAVLRLGRLRAAGENGGEERENGEGKEVRGSAHLLSEHEGEKRGSWARGLRFHRTEREREERLGRRGKELTSGARLSVRERGKGEKGRLGRGPGREGEGAGEESGRKAESREKRGKGKFHFLSFFKYIFPLAFFFQMNF